MLHVKSNNFCSLCVYFNTNPLAGYGYGICQKYFETVHIKDKDCHSYIRMKIESTPTPQIIEPKQLTLEL